MKSIVALFLAGVCPGLFAAPQLLPTPPGSGLFGHEVEFLPNGNFVVTDPSWSGDFEAMGAVYLYSPDGTELSRLTGSRIGDNVGELGVVVLANGNFLVVSPSWDGPGGAVDAGAITFGDGETGFGSQIAVVDASNSLVGTQTNDRIGTAVMALPNGHYVVASDHWSNGALATAGAVTWGNGNSGTVGEVSDQNSLVGTYAGDHVGESITVLPNSNYIVSSPHWDDAAINVGAVTWRDGSGPFPEEVSSANSMVGASAGDQAGWGNLVALTNGNAVFASPQWDDVTALDAGAVTWISGTQPSAGTIGKQNSLVGPTQSDHLGSGGLIALANGHFAVSSPDWDRGAMADAGAVTRGNGSGSAGVVGEGKSMVGSKVGDRVGSGGLTALANGDFVAVSPTWDDGVRVDAGAVTRLRGDGGTIGALDGATSIRGSHAGDMNFARVTPLANGSYVVTASFAQVGATVEAGAVRWCPSLGACTGVFDAANSLVGVQQGDVIGGGGVNALTDGNYVVSSPFADGAGLTDIGAVTWGDGSSGTVGTVDAANSLTGRAAGDKAGLFGIQPLPDGRYLVLSPLWSGATGAGVGAVTLAPAGQPFIGVIDELNSLHGLTDGDNLGWHSRALVAGDRALFAFWRVGQFNAPSTGAVVAIDTSLPTAGPVDLSQAILGVVPQGGSAMDFDYHEPTHTLVASDPLAGRVWLDSLGSAPSDEIFRDGFED